MDHIVRTSHNPDPCRPASNARKDVIPWMVDTLLTPGVRRGLVDELKAKMGSDDPQMTTVLWMLALQAMLYEE